MYEIIITIFHIWHQKIKNCVFFCHRYYWKHSDWIFVKSNIGYKCNYDLIHENKWCNHDTIPICQIFKMATAAILDSDLFAQGGVWHHPYLMNRGSEEL